MSIARSKDRRIVELEPVLPTCRKQTHLEKGGLLAGFARGDQTAHQLSDIDRKIGFTWNLSIRWRTMKRRISSISYSTLPFTGAKATIGDLLLAGLEDAAEQTGLNGEPRARALEDRGKRAIGEIDVRAGEIEQELDRGLHHHVSAQGRKSISKVHALRFWR